MDLDQLEHVAHLVWIIVGLAYDWLTIDGGSIVVN